jgi:hypothetical protein
MGVAQIPPVADALRVGFQSLVTVRRSAAPPHGGSHPQSYGFDGR